MRDTPVQVGSQTRLDLSRCGTSTLTDGLYVTVTGTARATGVAATLVRCDAEPKGPGTRLGRRGTVVSVDLTALCARDGVSPFEALFSESSARALVAVARSGEQVLVDLCTARGVPVVRLGETTETCERGAGEAAADVPADHVHEPALEVQGLFTLPLSAVREAHAGTLPRIFG